jgi:hypothetical protein
MRDRSRLPCAESSGSGGGATGTERAHDLVRPLAGILRKAALEAIMDQLPVGTRAIQCIAASFVLAR